MNRQDHQNILSAIRSYGNGLLRFIRERVNSDSDAEDILQDVWYQLSAIINSQPVEEMGAWLYRVARNKVIDKHRKKTESPWQSSPADVDEEPYARYLHSDHTPETLYFDRMVWEETWLALEALPPEQKNVFIWHELDGESFEEISRRTGEPVGRLVSRKYYAVQYLRKRLRVLYEELTEG